MYNITHGQNNSMHLSFILVEKAILFLTISFLVSKKNFFFICSVMADSLQPHGLQHSRLPCPSLSPRVCSNPCPLSLWGHPTISSFVVPFFCPQSSQHQGVFQWVGSSHQVAKVLELQLQHQSFQWFPTQINSGLISFRIDWFNLLAVQGTLKSLLQHHNSKATILWCSAFFMYIWI